MTETPTNVTPPPDLTYGYVDGRIILAIGDRSDAGRMPDPVPADGMTVTFTPANTILKVTSPTPATVIKQPIVCNVDANGYLVDGQAARGVWLVTGTYKVTYSHPRAMIPSHDIEVTTGHTEAAPLDLTTAMPPGGPVLTPSEYAELNGRLTILEAGGGGGGGGVTWSTISGKPAVVAEGATQADARTAIGAGTSSFSGAYADLTGKPTAMTPTTHASTHAAAGSDPLAVTGLGVGSLADGQMLVRSGSALVGQAVPSGGGSSLLLGRVAPVPVGAYLPVLALGGHANFTVSTSTQNSLGTATGTLVEASGAWTYDRVGLNVETAATDAGAAFMVALYALDGTLIADLGTLSAMTTGIKETTISLSLSAGTYMLVTRLRTNGTFAGTNPVIYGNSQGLGTIGSTRLNDNNLVTIRLWTGFTNNAAWPSTLPTPSEYGYFSLPTVARVSLRRAS